MSDLEDDGGDSCIVLESRLVFDNPPCNKYPSPRAAVAEKRLCRGLISLSDDNVRLAVEDFD